MRYFKDGTFADDPFAGAETLSGPDWLERRGSALPSPLVLQLDPGFDVEAIRGLGQERFGNEGLDGVACVKIAFPKFTDGRGYSMGWLLRTRLGYAGEMRAVGDVLYDEMQLMARCGFDGFEIVDEPTLALLRDGRRLETIRRFYQPGLEPEVPAGTRPWARRSA